MYGLSTIKGQITRGLAAVALAALVLLSSTHASGQARDNADAPVGRTADYTIILVNPGYVGLAWGQTMRLNLVLSDGSVRPVRARVRVSHNGAAILTRNHTPNSTSRFHSLDIGRGDLPVAGESRTGRVQPWVEVELVLKADARLRAEEVAARLYASNFELITDESGETVMVGMLLPAINGARENARR